MKIESREELIALGGTLASVLQGESFDKPWMINLGGDADSGKGLLALAIDQFLNPQRYPNGITKDISADIALAPGNEGSPQIVFCNFYKENAPARGKRFDERLSQFKAGNPGAKILIAANVGLPPQHSADQMLGLVSADCVDLDLQFQRKNGVFVEFPCSAISLATRESDLGRKMSDRIFRDTLTRSLGRFTIAKPALQP